MGLFSDASSQGDEVVKLSLAVLPVCASAGSVPLSGAGGGMLFQFCVIMHEMQTTPWEPPVNSERKVCRKNLKFVLGEMMALDIDQAFAVILSKWQLYSNSGNSSV
jgi:hypothetical protein